MAEGSMQRGKILYDLQRPDSREDSILEAFVDGVYDYTSINCVGVEEWL